FLPGAVTDVLALRDDHGIGRVVLAEHDLALERFAEGALEVAEGLGADAAEGRILVLDRRDAVLALGLDARKLQLFGQDLGQLIEAEVDLHDVRAGLGAALGAFALALADDVPFLAVARADAAAVVAVAKVRQLDAADGDRDEVLAFLADQL